MFVGPLSRQRAQAIIPTDEIKIGLMKSCKEISKVTAKRVKGWRRVSRLENLATGLMGKDVLDTGELVHIEETVMRLTFARAMLLRTVVLGDC